MTAASIARPSYHTYADAVDYDVYKNEKCGTPAYTLISDSTSSIILDTNFEDDPVSLLFFFDAFGEE